MAMRWKLDARIISDAIFLMGAGISIYYLLSQVISQITDGGPASAENKKKANASLQRLQEKYPGLDLDLNEYEHAILGSLVTPTEIKVTFEDIGGLDSIIEELRESVLYPLTVPGLYSQHSSLLQAPKGVLLFGPPGCGKTMLAKALASESSANFINIKMSTIMDKYYGESNKLAAAIFSLAQKLQPCIVFIDEIDSFLRERQAADHEVTAMLKAEFMTLWDGLTSDGRVLVLGATNRPNDIDNAILRRLPKRFAVSLPDAPQRRKIINILLRDTALESDFDIDVVVDQTAGLSGSDIKELCRNAAMAAIRDYTKANFVDGKPVDENARVVVRALRTNDFFSHQAAEPTLPLNYVREVS